jgi:hypothetical protein
MLCDILQAGAIDLFGAAETAASGTRQMQNAHSTLAVLVID